jgi:RNA polymerase sigma-70 factor (ECF subfamily)
MDFSSLSANELVQCCSNGGNNEAWREFVTRFQRPIALSVLRTARCWGIYSNSQLDDLVQETFLRLCTEDCRLLKSFIPREEDSAIGFLKMVAANITHDRLRAEKTLKRGGSFTRRELEAAELDGSLVSRNDGAALESSITKGEIDRALRTLVPAVLSERDRTVFWLYFEQGFSAREISEISSIGLTVKGVESCIHRTTQQIRAVLQPPAKILLTRPEGDCGPLAISKEKP